MKPTTIQVKKGWHVSKIVRKGLLICGILSTLLYVGTDFLAALEWEGYSYTSQSISELMAVGAPTRPYIVPVFIIYNVLVIAFGLGILAVGSRKRALELTGILLIVYGFLGEVGLVFFPMHLREAEKTMTDTMHITVTGITILLIIIFIGLGASALGKRFRFYSILTILILLLFGALAGMDGPRLAAQLPTPWMGIKERISVFTPLLWILVLAVILLSREGAPGPTDGSSV